MDPALINALSGIGFTGGLILAVWAYTTDRIVTGKALAKREADWQRRLTEAADDCRDRIARLEAKLDACTDAIRRQSEAQAATIAALQASLRREERSVRRDQTDRKREAG